MKHPDGTPYWTPAPMKANAEAHIDYSQSTGQAFTKGGSPLGEFASLQECAEEFIGEVINCIY